MKPLTRKQREQIAVMFLKKFGRLDHEQCKEVVVHSERQYLSRVYLSNKAIVSVTAEGDISYDFSGLSL